MLKTEIILIICETERKKKLDLTKNIELKDISEIKNKTAEEIYSLCGISKVMPISFDKLTKILKVKIMGTDFNFISNLDEVKEVKKDNKTILGMVNIENNYANIYYNNNSGIDIPTQRFTIAHELAHCINHYDELSVTGKVEFLEDRNYSNHGEITNCDDVHEYVCNKFARDFLIPSEMLRKLYNAMPNPRIPDLANLFLVPENEMKIKLEEIGLVRADGQ